MYSLNLFQNIYCVCALLTRSKHFAISHTNKLFSMGKYVKEIECFLRCEFFWQFVFLTNIFLFFAVNSTCKLMNGIRCEYLNYLRKRWRRNIFCSRYGSLDVLLSQSHSYVPEYDSNWKLVFIGAEYDHRLHLSLTIKPADSMATTGKSCANKKVPISQMNISLLANFRCFFSTVGALVVVTV